MTEWKDHLLTEEERQAFDTDGYFLVKDALASETVDRVNAAMDKCEREAREEKDGKGDGRLNQHDLIERDDVFLNLIDHPPTFAKVFGVLGWNIQLFHTQMVITPGHTAERIEKRLGWHQDNNRMNKDFETAIPSHPRVSMKVAYFLSDTRKVGRANFYIVPGSHESGRINYASENDLLPEGALATQVKPGDALFFDRRLWHASSPNVTDVERRVLFYGYSYRWLRTKSTMDHEHLYDQVDPIRRQLLGYATSGNGRFSPKEEDVPLREWIRDNLGEDAVAK
jgi:ectoine hydroxylase